MPHEMGGLHNAVGLPKRRAKGQTAMVGAGMLVSSVCERSKAEQTNTSRFLETGTMNDDDCSADRRKEFHLCFLSIYKNDP
ncbi:hypothetical protein LINPERHAP1_LOCUS42751 [Linum perenne]